MFDKTTLMEGAPKAGPAPVGVFSYARDFLDNKFVYLTVSSRARGLSVGINMNPDKICNFDCVYCEVDRSHPPVATELDIPTMVAELERTLQLISSGQIRERHPYNSLNRELAQLRHVAFSGDGDPTQCPNFGEAVETVVHIRARRVHPFFKIVLITNGSGLDLQPVQDALQYFTAGDDIWIKLDAGTQAYMDKVNRSGASLDKLLHNVRLIGCSRPIVIQSMFPLIAGEEPSADEISQYLERLKELKRDGVRISLVQVYSATRPSAHPECAHMPLKSLSRIKQRIKAEAGLNAEVF
jgi:wyosine [tRNA(Phe)-imidazoG37] synthetase (radical SAM superfamily)